jgi:hypothetical protein
MEITIAHDFDLMQRTCSFVQLMPPSTSPQQIFDPRLFEITADLVFTNCDEYIKKDAPSMENQNGHLWI